MSSPCLDDRVIAIAGVGGGLGPVVAARLAEDGAIVAGTDRDQGALDALASELAIPEDRWDGRAVDLLDEDAARAWCAALVERFGRVDGLLHLVGGWRGGEPLHEAPLADWDLLHDLLIRTLQHTTRAFHDQLVVSPHGRFVLVSAKQAQQPTNANAAYAAAKAAAEAWTLALADGFATTTLGATLSPPNRGTKRCTATANIVVVDAILTPQMRAERPGKDFPTFTPAEHIAEAIAFLCSDAAAKMNGQRLALHP
ncbi:MAG TPA: SDR family oxidoreductase [Solirubrobacterales bacterium]|nr:SDR family oxidoreductase [Solirubrobacterales bacterium]